MNAPIKDGGQVVGEVALDGRLRCLQSLLQQMGADAACEAVSEARDVIAHLTPSAQAVDVEAIREVIEELNDYCEASDGRGHGTLSTSLVRGYTIKLTRALGNAQAGDKALQSRLAAADALLRECRRLAAHFFKSAQPGDLYERIDAHLSDPTP